jgi:pentatricopeptide repeat protein
MRKKRMDKEKFEKMVEMMKGYCVEGSISSCCSMMKKMMQGDDRKETTEKNEKDAVETE